MKDKKYFDSKEAEDMNKLTNFNNKVLHLNQLGETPYKHWTDASGYTRDERYFNMELKERNQTLKQDENGNYYIEGTTNKGTTYTASTLYIEQHKLCSMMLDYITEGKEPIYINFLQNGVIVFNLSKLKRRPVTENKKIHSKGYGQMEIGTREGLWLTDAAIYDNNFTLIQRPAA